MVPEDLRKGRFERAARFNAQKVLASASDLPSIAAKADDLEEIKKSVEDAAAVSGGIWFSYLFVLFYLAVAAGAVTHTDLLLENPVKLPFLNIDLPLRAFFFLAPFLFVTAHLYALVHFKMLGRKASHFHDELRRQLPDDIKVGEALPKDIRDKVRRLLPSNIFVQILAGPPESRGGAFGFILKVIALTTLVFFPILLLLLLQAQFLPYHDLTTTWAQRIALLLDIAVLWILRPSTHPEGPRGWIGQRGNGDSSKQMLMRRTIDLGVPAMVNVLVIWLSWVIATIPGEWQETGLAWLDPKLSTAVCSYGKIRLECSPVRKILFAGEVDDITRRRKSLFSNTLVLPGFNLYEALKIDDPKKVDWREHLVDWRGRHLEGAVLDDAILTKADLTGVDLEGASLNAAQLQGVSLENAQLKGASLPFANLKGSSLRGVHLEGASLNWAQLQGASFDRGYLQGASLALAQLEGASFKDAQLQGALLERSQLQGTSFVSAHLEGASFEWADLKGASFSEAHLEGASLNWAQVRGADFSLTTMIATDLLGTYLWRTSLADTVMHSIRLRGETWTPTFIENNEPGVGGLPLPWTPETFIKLQKLMEMIPNEQQRLDALGRIAALDCQNPDDPSPCSGSAPESPNAQVPIERLNEANVSDAAFKTELASVLGSLACSADQDAIYILRGVLNNGRIHELGNKGVDLIKVMMTPACPVSVFLTKTDRSELSSAMELSADPK